MSEEKEKSFLTIEDILYHDSVSELYVPTLDKWVKIKNASTKDKIDAHKLAINHPAWNLFDEDEKNEEVGRMLMIQLLVDPKITYEQYLETNNIQMQLLLAAIYEEFITMVAKITMKDSKELNSFLDQMKGEPLESSTASSDSETLNGKDQPKPG